MDAIDDVRVARIGHIGDLPHAASFRVEKMLSCQLCAGASGWFMSPLGSIDL
jgi:hypothetical protein